MEGFTSPQQMRAALADMIPDGSFLDRMIGEYFKDAKPAPLPVHAPASGYVKRSYKEPAVSADLRQREDYLTHMREASLALGEAIDTYLAGGIPRTPSDLVWRKNHSLGTAERIFVERRAIPTVAFSAPCVKCGAARSCKHRGGE